MKRKDSPKKRTPLRELLKGPQVDPGAPPKLPHFVYSPKDKMMFVIYGTELKRVRDFQKKHKCSLPDASRKVRKLTGRKKKQGAIGGQYSYRFVPTSLGVGVYVKCACGKKENVTDYDSW